MASHKNNMIHVSPVISIGRGRGGGVMNISSGVDKCRRGTIFEYFKDTVLLSYISENRFSHDYPNTEVYFV